MHTHSEIQGTPAWLALRRNYFTASEAAAVMGDSPYCTRTQLLQQKATGITPEIDARTQARFDAGHAAEAAFRPIAENIVGVDFYPVTGSIEIDGLKLLASFDGISADDSVLFEHKLFSHKLADMCLNMGDVTDPAYYWQLEQQLLVSGAERVEFFTSDGTDSKFAQTTYTSQPDRRESLIAAWKQFASDLAEYVPAEYVAPAPVGRAPETLPALRVELSGVVTASNLQVYKEAAIAVFRNINRELITDQDFSDAKKTVKWCSDVEESLKGGKKRALSQTESVDLLFRTMDELITECREVRLNLDGVIKGRSLTRRTDMVTAGRAALVEHVESLNKRLGYPFMPGVPADFAGAIKGMSSFDSMQNAIDTALANAKIEANRRADEIEQNLQFLEAKGLVYKALFPDINQLVLQGTELFTLKVNARIAEHEEALKKRLEADRERIRAEEVQKLADAAAAEAKRIADAEAARVASEAAASIPVQIEQIAEQSAPVLQKAARTGMAMPNTPLHQLSIDGAAFIASRQWPNESTRNTARSIVIEYEKFCAQQLKVAA